MVDWMLSMLGKGSIMSTSALLTYVITKYNYPRVFNPWIPTMVVALIAYVTASVFLNIFSFSALTILHSFLLDEESGKSVNTPPELADFMEDVGRHNAGGNQVSEKEEGDAE